MSNNVPQYTPTINSDTANFIPVQGDYKTLQPFRYWCQKVLPLVYDDSLSYYELLCKVVDYLNKTMEDVETLNGDVDDMYTAFGQLQSYTNTSITDLRSDYQDLVSFVNNYFASLDVQQEINNKLDAMASNGTLTALVTPYIPSAVAVWLSEHITPTTPAVDNTLSVSGAAADAKVTGDKINGIKSAVNPYLTFTETPGYFSSSGAIESPTSTQQEVYTNKIAVNDYEKLNWAFNISVTKGLWIAYICYGDNEIRLNNRTDLYTGTGTSASGVLELPKNTKYIAFCYRTFGESNTFEISVCAAPTQIFNDIRQSTPTKILDQTISAKTWSTGTLFYLPAGVIMVDATNITSDSLLIYFRTVTSVSGYQYYALFLKGEKRYFYIPESCNVLYLNFSTAETEQNVKIYSYPVGEIITEAGTFRRNPLWGKIEEYPVVKGAWGVSGLASSTTRFACGLFKYTGIFTITLSDYENYKFSVVIYDVNTGLRVVDSGWKQADYSVYADENTIFGVTLCKVPESTISDADLTNSGLEITSNYYTPKLATAQNIDALNQEIEEINEHIDDVAYEGIHGDNSNLALFSGRFKPCYDHLFVNRTGNNVIIPHESLYHVRLSRKMGFNTIEANVAATSDGVFIVNHLNAGKFGGYFHHVDGETDISNIALNSVTWDWVSQNVRYNSTIKKYQTRPCRLEEFLAECRQQNIIPFITSTNPDVIKIAEQYMGKNNYIAYGGSRANCPSAIIYHWASQATKTDILAYCNTIGKPFIYGMANPTSFTDSELKEIISAVHEGGFWIGTSYADTNWSKYSAMGMDFNGTQQLINRIDNGNLHNIDTIYGFDDFTVTGATETDGVLTFSESGDIYPDIENTVYNACGIDVEIWFNGSITFYAIGELGSTNYTSDGSQPIVLSIPIIHGSPKWHIGAANGCVVYDIKFKASVF